MVLYTASIFDTLSNLSGFTGMFAQIGKTLQLVWDSIVDIFEYIPTILSLPFSFSSSLPSVLLTSMILLIGVAVFRVAIDLL